MGRKESPGALARKVFLNAYPSDPTRPVLTALRAALCDRSAALIELLPPRVYPSDMPSLLASPDLTRLTKEFYELWGWAFGPQSKEEREKPLHDTAQSAISDGWSRSEVNKWLKSACAPPGRPVTKRRQVAIAVLEARQRDRRLSWQKIPARFCDCGKGKNDHTADCIQSIRQAVMGLQKLMRKYGIPY